MPQCVRKREKEGRWLPFHSLKILVTRSSFLNLVTFLLSSFFNLHTVYLSLKIKATMVPWHLQKTYTHWSIRRLIWSILGGTYRIRYCARHRRAGYINSSCNMNSDDLSSNLSFFRSYGLDLACVSHLSLWFSSFFQIPYLSHDSTITFLPLYRTLEIIRSPH